MRRIRWLVGGAGLIALAVGLLWLRGGGPRWEVRVGLPDSDHIWCLADRGRAVLSRPTSLVDSDFSGAVEVRDGETGGLLRTIWSRDHVFTVMEASPHGPWIAAVTEAEGKPTLHWADLRTGETRNVRLPARAGRHILFSPVGDLVFVGVRPVGGPEHLLAVHLSSGERVGWLRRRSPSRADEGERLFTFEVEERFGGRWLFLLDGYDPTRVILWDCLAHKHGDGFSIGRDEYPASLERIEVSPDGRTLTALRLQGSDEAPPDDAIQVWDLGEPAKPALARTMSADPAADPRHWNRRSSPCGRWVADLVLDTDSRLRIFDTAVGTTRETRLPQTGADPRMRFSDAGRVWLSHEVGPSPPSGWLDWLPPFLRGRPRPIRRIYAIDQETDHVAFQTERANKITDLLPLPDGAGVITVEAGEGTTLLCRHDAVRPPVWPSVLALLALLAGAGMLLVGAWPWRKTASSPAGASQGARANSVLEKRAEAPPPAMLQLLPVAAAR